MRLSRPVLGYKLKAASASLAVFLIFATALAFLSYHYWYPDYLFWTDGGIQGLRLIYAVDFVLGPILALVFFHPEKSRPKLIFDIAVIAIVQFSAMVWGAYQVYSQRPIAVVFGSERFISVAPHIMWLQSKSPEDMQAFSNARPPFVFRRDPVSVEEKGRMTALLFQRGFHSESQAWLFQPFQPNLEHIFSRQAGIRQYLRDNMAAEQKAWDMDQSHQSMAKHRLAFYEGRYENAVLIFSAEGSYLDYLPMGTTPIPNLKPDPVSQ